VLLKRLARTPLWGHYLGDNHQRPAARGSDYTGLGSPGSGPVLAGDLIGLFEVEGACHPRIG
jgi:hypothetical protein